mgnify:CR=1 FL=1
MKVGNGMEPGVVQGPLIDKSRGGESRGAHRRRDREGREEC